MSEWHWLLLGGCCHWQQQQQQHSQIFCSMNHECTKKEIEVKTRLFSLAFIFHNEMSNNVKQGNFCCPAFISININQFISPPSILSSIHFILHFPHHRLLLCHSKNRDTYDRGRNYDVNDVWMWIHFVCIQITRRCLYWNASHSIQFFWLPDKVCHHQSSPIRTCPITQPTG